MLFGHTLHKLSSEFTSSDILCEKWPGQALSNKEFMCIYVEKRKGKWRGFKHEYTGRI